MNIELDEAIRRGREFLEASRRPNEPEMDVDVSRVRQVSGDFVLPYNSLLYLETRDPHDLLLDCWPIVVDGETGNCRFSTIEERLKLR